MKNKIYILYILLGLVFVQKATAQEDRRILQFTGIVVNEEDEDGVPGVHIYIPKGGRGSTTNVYGYFSMPVLVGDSLIISAVGFVKQHLIIPDYSKDSYTVIISLIPDITYLEELEVYPFPSEQMFKEAVLALQLPNQGDLDNMQRNVDQRMLGKIYGSAALGASGNHYYFMSQQAAAYNNKYQTQSISLMNPFAWSQFIKSIKKRQSEK